jgi:hypothetical protein
MRPNQFRAAIAVILLVTVLLALRAGLTAEKIGAAGVIVGLLSAELGLRTPQPAKKSGNDSSPPSDA